LIPQENRGELSGLEYPIHRREHNSGAVG